MMRRGDFCTGTSDLFSMSERVANGDKGAARGESARAAAPGRLPDLLYMQVILVSP
jgi:hypothetical protein